MQIWGGAPMQGETGEGPEGEEGVDLILGFVMLLNITWISQC